MINVGERGLVGRYKDFFESVWILGQELLKGVSTFDQSVEHEVEEAGAKIPHARCLRKL